MPSLYFPIVWFKEGSMVLRHFSALAVHYVEQILAGVRNAPDLNKRGADLSNDDVGFIIPDFAVDYLDKRETRLGLGERCRKVENYFKHRILQSLWK